MARNSRAKAINKHCKSCIYDSAVEGSWRAQVEACKAEGICNLWEFRPMTVASVRARRASNKEEAEEAPAEA